MYTTYRQKQQINKEKAMKSKPFQQEGKWSTFIN